MSLPGLVPQPAAPRAETAEAAALRLARASLEALALKAGQVLEGRVGGMASNGLTQLSIAGQLLNVRLPQPLPAGTQLTVQVQAAGPQSLPVLVVQPRTAPQPAAPMPALPAMLRQLPLPPAATLSPAPQVQTPLPPPPAGTPPPAAQALQAARPIIPIPGTPAVPAAPAIPNIAAPSAAPAVQPPASPPAAPAWTAAVNMAPQTPNAPAPAIPPSPAGMPAPAPTLAAPASATNALPGQPAAPTAPMPLSAPANPAMAPQSPVPPAAAQAAPAAPPATVSSASPPQRQHVGVALPSSAMPRPAPASLATSSPASPTSQAPADPLPPSSSQPIAAVGAAPLPAAPAPLRAALPAAAPIPARPPAAAAAQLTLAQTTQAAAQQDSIAPLLQNLSAIRDRAGELPRPVMEAARRLLAGRLSLDHGGPTGEDLKRAVLRSGDFLDALAKPAAGQPLLPGDTKAALLQLRGALTAWLGEGIAPVTPVTRRPQPPIRGAQPRAERSEPPTLPQSSTLKEAGRVLLGQTEAALSRVRLLQLASVPQDAARNAATGPASATEWHLEIPLVLGHELAVAQLQVSRDGKGRSERRERGWRMQFSLNFSALGEVGALVSLVGKSTGVVIWAEADETAAVLTEMLPELTSALAGKGLEVGSVRVRHGRPKQAQPQSGQLLDSVR